MKILKYYLFVFLLVGAFGCSKDDDSNKTTDNILGKWNATEFKISGEFEDDGINGTFRGSSTNMAGNYVDFKENNTYTAQSNPMMMNMEFKMGDLRFEQTIPVGSTLAETGSWQKNGNKLIIENDEQRSEFDIVTLTSTTLELRADENSVDWGDDEPEGIVSMEVLLTFKR